MNYRDASIRGIPRNFGAEKRKSWTSLPVGRLRLKGV